MEGALLWLVAAVLAVGVVGLSLLVYQLLRQQGRLLLRVEQLEGALGGGRKAPAPEVPKGLAVGTPISFDLPDLDGEQVSMERFRGQRVLLVHWNIGCGFCTQIASDLAELQGALRKRGTDLLLMSYGDAEANRAQAVEYGLDAPILLEEQGRQHATFSGLGTPAAYLLDEGGRVAEPLALGALEVPDLLRAVAAGHKRLGTERSLDGSRLERDGLPPGTKAPKFELEDVRGGKVSLDEYRGRNVLLVFSDPDCGPCNALLTDLARVQHETSILMVSRGDPEVNRVKAEEHGLDFPVVVQKGWKLSKDYGIFATPVAFLVDEEGVIAKPVARGRDEIVALAEEAPAGKEAELAL